MCQCHLSWYYSTSASSQHIYMTGFLQRHHDLGTPLDNNVFLIKNYCAKHLRHLMHDCIYSVNAKEK